MYARFYYIMFVCHIHIIGFIFFTPHLVLFCRSQVTDLPLIEPLRATSSCCRRLPQAASSGKVRCCCWWAGCGGGRLGFPGFNYLLGTPPEPWSRWLLASAKFPWGDLLGFPYSYCMCYVLIRPSPSLFCAPLSSILVPTCSFFCLMYICCYKKLILRYVILHHLKFVGCNGI
jgi:hypothetical protein